MKVSIVGAGNLCWHLAQAIENAGHNVVEIYARNRKKARNISSLLYDTEVTNSLNLTDSNAEIFILAVSDAAIKEISQSIQLPQNSLLVHTSGATSLAVLENARVANQSLNIGVFYPLMTFTKGTKLEFAQAPLLLEGEDPRLKKLAKSVAKKFKYADSTERARYHTAAVFSCNFTNHLFALSKEIIEEKEGDFELLKPLIKETIKKSLAASHPADVQTGPALRKDQLTIEKHRDILKEDDDLLLVYDRLTESIQDWHLGE